MLCDARRMLHAACCMFVMKAICMNMTEIYSCWHLSQSLGCEDLIESILVMFLIPRRVPTCICRCLFINAKPQRYAQTTVVHQMTAGKVCTQPHTHEFRGQDECLLEKIIGDCECLVYKLDAQETDIPEVAMKTLLGVTC